MKKNNKKGFSAFELIIVLIVLLILAVVAYNITIKISNKARVKAFQVSINNIENWITQQYEMSIYTGNIMNNDSSKAYLNLCENGNCFYEENTNKKGIILNLDNDIDKSFIKASGNKYNNYSYIDLFIHENSKSVCVRALVSPDGEFYYKGIEKDKLNFYQSSSCSNNVFKNINEMGDINE